MDTATRAAAWAKKLLDLSGVPSQCSDRILPIVPPTRPYPVTDLIWSNEDPIKVAFDLQIGEGRSALLLNFTGPVSPLEALTAGEPPAYELPDIYLRSNLALWTLEMLYPIEPYTALKHQNVSIFHSDGTLIGMLDIVSCDAPTEEMDFLYLYKLACVAATESQKEVLVIPAWPGITESQMQNLLDCCLAESAFVREIVFVGCPRPAGY